MLDSDKVPYCQAIGQILICDSALTDGEHQFLSALMDRLSLTADQRGAVIGGINVGDDVVPLIAGLSEAARGSLVDDAVAASQSDGEVGPREQVLVNRIRDQVGRG